MEEGAVLGERDGDGVRLGVVLAGHLGLDPQGLQRRLGPDTVLSLGAVLDRDLK